MATYWYVSNSRDGWQNLAMDEWFLDNLQPDDLILYFYINKNAVIIGKNQNPWKECNLQAMEQDNVQLVRRITGGGAVYHDEGNLNFSFIAGENRYDLEKQLQVMVQQTPKITEITGRSAQNGDEVVLDYAGFCDGEQFAGGTAQKQTLTLGSGAFIPGFEQQLIGANIGDDVSVKVTFPQQYHAENLAGKEAEFKCHIHATRAKSAWELGDEFAPCRNAGLGLELIRTVPGQPLLGLRSAES